MVRCRYVVSRNWACRIATHTSLPFDQDQFPNTWKGKGASFLLARRLFLFSLFFPLLFNFENIFDNLQLIHYRLGPSFLRVDDSHLSHPDHFSQILLK